MDISGNDIGICNIKKTVFLFGIAMDDLKIKINLTIWQKAQNQ